MPITGMRPRTALLGGSFDPPHLGHIHLMHEVAVLTPIGRLIVIPANISNFKQDSRPASFHDRAAMLRLLVSDYRAMFPSDVLDVEVSCWEGEQGGVSYTSDTIRHFLPDIEDGGRVNFIIGDDILARLSSWHDYGYLCSNVRFWCFSRGDKASPPEGADVVMIPSEILAASSTEIRGGDEKMLSESVRKYIHEHDLYRA